jgi:hypothetical protein
MIIVGSLVHFAKGHGRERLGIRVPTLANRSPVPSDMEPHPTVTSINTVIFQKLHSCIGNLQPLLAGLNIVVKLREHPACSALLPNPLIGVDDCSITIQASHYATASLIDAMSQPKRDHIIEQIIAVATH